MLLAVRDTSVFRLLERPVVEHQLRVVLLSSRPLGHVLRGGEPPPLGADGRGLGLCLWHGQSDSARLYFVSRFAPSRFVEFLVGVFVARIFLTPPRSNLGEV